MLFRSLCRRHRHHGPSFFYLGSTIPTDNSLDIEVRTRLLKANRAYFSLIRLFRSKTLKISTKLLLYRTMVLPVLMYSSETWALSQKQGESIAAFERKILRRIFGPVHEVGRFRSLYNHEVYERYNGVDVVKLIRLNRLRWAGHLYRMSEDDPARKVFSGSILGMRRRDRPCLRWKDGVDQDAKKNWNIELATVVEESNSLEERIEAGHVSEGIECVKIMR